MKKFVIVSLSLSLAVAASVSARQADEAAARAEKAGNTILATYTLSKASAGSVSLDIQTDGQVTAMDFLVKLPKGIKGLNLDNCLSGLPATHTGACKASKDGSKVAVVVYSVSNKAFPTGLVSLGEINYASGVPGSVSIEKVTMAGSSGHDSRPVDVQVVPIDVDVRKPRKEML